MGSSFYENLVEESDVMDLVKDNSKLPYSKIKGLEQSVKELVPYSEGRITKITHTPSYKALAEISKQFLYIPFGAITLPTNTRKLDEMNGLPGVGAYIVSQSVGGLVGGGLFVVGLSHLVVYGPSQLTSACGAYLTTNALSGLWELFRNKRNRIIENKNGKK